ncbi:MAG: hypothetical protein CL802_11505 [Citromicrobium sp.]|nr:hypothetical protein [Citromicrobium sp.]|tara:strand:- start:384 stop:611 length:228 start_codon:yes stop_codon:yes gene_type:complete
MRKLIALSLLCLLSFVFAAFLAAWGPSSIVSMYRPNFDGQGFIREVVVLAILYSPALFGIGIALRKLGHQSKGRI